MTQEKLLKDHIIETSALKIAMFIFLSTSKSQSHNALTEGSGIVPIQLHSEPAVKFVNEHNVKGSANGEQRFFMMHRQ